MCCWQLNSTTSVPASFYACIQLSVRFLLQYWNSVIPTSFLLDLGLKSSGNITEKCCCRTAANDVQHCWWCVCLPARQCTNTSRSWHGGTSVPWDSPFINYFPRESGCKVLRWVHLPLCLSVRKDISGTVCDLYLIFCACCLCAWLSPPPPRWREATLPIAGKGFSFPLTMHYNALAAKGSFDCQ